MKRFAGLSFAAILAAAVGAKIIFSSDKPSHEAAASLPSASEASAQKAAETEPKVQYPVPSEEKSGSKSSNGRVSSADYDGKTIEGALSDLIGRDLFDAIFNPDDFGRRIVVAIENATSPTQLSLEHSPLKPLDSAFVTTRNEIKRRSRPTISSDIQLMLSWLSRSIRIK